MCGKPGLSWEDSLGRFLCQRIGSRAEKPQCWELSRGAACPLGRVAPARGQEKATRNCGFQTGVLVTPSQKFMSHSNQNTRTHRIKTLFKEQLLALLYEAFSPFKKKKGFVVVVVVVVFNAGHDLFYFACHLWGRIQFEKTLRRRNGRGRCGRRQAGEMSSRLWSSLACSML